MKKIDRQLPKDLEAEIGKRLEMRSVRQGINQSLKINLELMGEKIKKLKTEIKELKDAIQHKPIP